jgi:hypothetical protein
MSVLVGSPKSCHPLCLTWSFGSGVSYLGCGDPYCTLVYKWADRIVKAAWGLSQNHGTNLSSWTLSSSLFAHQTTNGLLRAASHMSQEEPWSWK